MNLIQYLDDADNPKVALVRNADTVETLPAAGTLYDLARSAIEQQSSLATLAEKMAGGKVLDYESLIDRKRLLPPLLHPDPAHTLISGTGLTHLGSADTRAAMHSKMQDTESELTDSMRMFRLGLEGGKPPPGKRGVQPEWFYKGDGDAVVAPEHSLSSPDFGLDLGDEAEIVGIYIIGDDCRAYRLGFALGNEYSDHKMEQINYLYLAHSKLRQCAYGPELLLGDLPADIIGRSRIVRNGSTLWEKEFLSGENNMSHTISNLESHHFKYQIFLRPGDVHIHYFGTGTLSFADAIEACPGDTFELESGIFGKALRNTYQGEKPSQNFNKPIISL